MSPDMVWFDHLNKPDTKLNARGAEWKNLMSECLMASQIKTNECFSDTHLNPNIVMNVRHQMAKECIKTSPIPRRQIQNEAMKLLRKENNQKLLRMKEENMIKKEIENLKQIFEFNERLTKKYLQTDEKRKHEQPLPRISSRGVKLWLVKPSRQCRMGKIKQSKISKREIFKEETKKLENPSCRMMSHITSARKECFENEKDEIHVQMYDENCDENCKKTFERAEEEEEINKVEIKVLPSLLDKMNRKRVIRAWQTWRIYTQRQRRREREKKIYVDKIEAFLEKLLQPEEETKAKLRISTCKQEPKIFKLPERAKTTMNTDRLEKLQKLMQEVRTSQTEVLQRLRCKKESTKKVFPNPKFLFRMEKRREERLKRRREIQERKHKLKIEKEIIERQKEKEEKKLKEQEKQKRLEELEEKQRAEKEKKEEERKKRDKLRRNEFLANSHYRKFLLRNYGIRPWIQMMKLVDAQYKQAVEFYDRRLLLSLVEWRISIRKQVERKERHAEQLYRRNLLKRCWNSWVEFRAEKMSKKQVATDWNDFKITERTFRNWIWFTEKEQSEYLKKKEIAEFHYIRKIKIRCLQKLQSYPEYKKEEREIEIRKLKWRQKVKEVLPDYQPVKITED